jgi:Tfp pilus assembly protein PilE
MRAISGILGLVLVLGIVYFVYTTQFSKDAGSLPPKQQIDLTAVRSDLLSLAQAERRYFATNGNYATLEQLQQTGTIQFPVTGRRGYAYSMETGDAQKFRITAKPSDPARAEWPTLSIDETMQFSTQQ